MIRYTITAIKASGQREIAFAANSRSTYDTPEEAQQHLNDVVNHNTWERVKELVGDNLEVRPVDCYEGGDPKTRYFE